MSGVLRQMATCYWLQLKVISTSWFDGALAVFWPVAFATATLLVYRMDGDAAGLQYAGLGAAIMGTWTCQGVVAANLLARERQGGTLELLVAAPTSMTRVLVPTTLALSTIGVYCVVAVFLWERWVFGLHLRIESWPLFLLAVLVTSLTLALVGFLLSVTAVRYRVSWALGSSLEYPGWLLCGFVVPVSLLPAWTHPLSWIIPTTWGMSAVRDAADGADPSRNLLVCLGVGAAYAVLAELLGRRLVESARRHASLALR